MSKNDPTIEKRITRYYASQRAKGLTPIKIWVPAEQAESFRAAARRERRLKAERDELKALLD